MCRDCADRFDTPVREVDPSAGMLGIGLAIDYRAASAGGNFLIVFATPGLSISATVIFWINQRVLILSCRLGSHQRRSGSPY